MKIAILSSAPAGGAGIAAFRIYESFQDTTMHEVDFFDIDTFDEAVCQAISPQISATNKKISNTHFTIDYASDIRGWVVELLSGYDVLNVQWASYLISLSEIHELARRGKKILFTLHDFHYITGGCHYPAGCLGYLKNCVGCPQVNEKLCSQKTVISTNKLKRSIFSYPNVHLSAPSAFIVKSALNSDIVPKERAHILRNAYTPICDYSPSQNTAEKSILLIADSFDEQRKGLSLAVDSLKLASKTFKQADTNVTLHLVGGLDTEVVKRLDGSGIKVIAHGYIKEHAKLVDIFKQCQFILTCSYEDNWPNILVESGSYGCVPIVGKWHGCEEFANVFGVGYVAAIYMPEEFSEAITSAIYDDMSAAAVSAYVNDVRNMHLPARVIAAYVDVIEGSQKYTVQHNFNQLVDYTSVSFNHLASVNIKFIHQTMSIRMQATPFANANSRLKNNTSEISCVTTLMEFITANSPRDEYVYGLANIEYRENIEE